MHSMNPSIVSLLHSTTHQSIDRSKSIKIEKKGHGDAWPDPVKLPKKGTYTIRYQVRHDAPAKLKRLEKMTVWAERSLSPAVDLPCFADVAEVSKSVVFSPVQAC